jgi:hypothetical protein
MYPGKHALKSCFISARYGADLGALPGLLDRFGIDWQWAKSDLAYTDRLAGDLRKIIRSVDFFIGVLLGEPADATTVFELGIAVGIGRPVLLIIAGDRELSLPFEGLPHVRTPLADENALALHLDLFAQRVRRGFRYAYSGRGRGVALSSAELFGVKQPLVFDSRPENALEAEVGRLIESAGGRVVLHPRPDSRLNRYTPDILFWLRARSSRPCATLEMQWR